MSGMSAGTSRDKPTAAIAPWPIVGEWWRTPDGILWRVDHVGDRKVHLSTSRSYGVMKATMDRAVFERVAVKETVDA